MVSTVVPAELTGELAQTLFNLTLENNEIRSACVRFPSHLPSCTVLTTNRFSAEKSLNERLARMPDFVIIVLGQFTVAADTEMVSSKCRFDTILSGHVLSFKPHTLQTLRSLFWIHDWSVCFI